jgi:Na+-driven multidrug efflux pump
MLATIRQFLLLPLVIIVPRLLGSGVNGIWISIPLSDVLATIVTLVLLRVQIKDIDKMSA